LYIYYVNSAHSDDTLELNTTKNNLGIKHDGIPHRNINGPIPWRWLYERPIVLTVVVDSGSTQTGAEAHTPHSEIIYPGITFNLSILLWE